jgi:hypothetical protein
MSVDPSFQAQLVLRSGFGALAEGMFGMGWLGWGLGTAHAFTPTVITLFDVFGILLFCYSIYFIRKGRSLRGNDPASSNTLTQRMNRQFIGVVVLEFAAIAILVTIAYAFIVQTWLLSWPLPWSDSISFPSARFFGRLVTIFGVSQ